MITIVLTNFSLNLAYLKTLSAFSSLPIFTLMFSLQIHGDNAYVKSQKVYHFIAFYKNNILKRENVTTLFFKQSVLAEK